MLSEMRRGLRAQRVREAMLRLDASTKEVAAASQALRAKRDSVKEGNRRAATVVGLNVGDWVQIRWPGHLRDGAAGTLSGFRDLPSGRRLGQVTWLVERFSSAVPLPPARLCLEVDVERLHYLGREEG